MNNERVKRKGLMQTSRQKFCQKKQEQKSGANFAWGKIGKIEKNAEFLHVTGRSNRWKAKLEHFSPFFSFSPFFLPFHYCLFFPFVLFLRCYSCYFFFFLLFALQFQNIFNSFPLQQDSLLLRAIYLTHSRYHPDMP